MNYIFHKMLNSFCLFCLFFVCFTWLFCRWVGAVFKIWYTNFYIFKIRTWNFKNKHKYLSIEVGGFRATSAYWYEPFYICFVLSVDLLSQNFHLAKWVLLFLKDLLHSTNFLYNFVVYFTNGTLVTNPDSRRTDTVQWSFLTLISR